VHLPQRPSRQAELGQRTVDRLTADLPKNNAGYPGEVTGKISSFDERDWYADWTKDLQDGNFTPQIGFIGQLQKRDKSVALYSKDLIAREG
jgi:hypothetical protein